MSAERCATCWDRARDTRSVWLADHAGVLHAVSIAAGRRWRGGSLVFGKCRMPIAGRGAERAPELVGSR